MKGKETLTAKDRAMLKVLIQYEVKPLKDEVRRLRKELTKSVKTNSVQFRQKNGQVSEPPY